MSTLGGSKGERQAKPKYAALDINRLYKNSRGESLEPSTQKNQVPRKHGMQILGKVPTSRRPPANLPSLKAETLTPGSPAQEQGGNQVGGSNSGSSVQSGNNNVNASSTASRNPIITSQPHLTSSTSSSQLQLQTPPALNSSSLSANSSGTHLSSYSSNSSNFGGSNSSVTWSSVTTGHDGGSSNIPPLYQSPQFQHEFPSLDGNAPNVTHAPHKAHHKDSHYHHGGRDGSGAGGGAMTSNSGSIQGGKGGENQNANVGDVQQISLRPHTDAASWIQQQSGSGKGGDLHGTPPGQVPLQAAPPQFRALMPSFMNRGAGGVLIEEPTTTGSGARPPTPPVHAVANAGGGDRGPPNQGGGPDHHNQQNGSFPAPAPSNRNRQPPAYQGGGVASSGQKEQRTNSPNTTSYPPNNSSKSQDERYSGRAPMPKRGQPPSIAPRFSQRPEAQNSNADNSLPYIEPEDVLVQRPIIKEEDLERMDTIAKDDGWTRQDDIDYNQKLVFSDDELGESTSAASGGKKAAALRQQEEDNRAVWARERDHLERVEREHLERERNERNEREHRFAEMNREKAERERDWERGRDRERDRDKDRERVAERERDRDTPNDTRSSSASRKSGVDQPRPQQNGHRGGLEPAVYERVKQRKEEEEKREFERKQAAAKKLQELEMKIGVKKNEEEVPEDTPKTSSANEEDFAGRTTRPYRGEKEGREGRDARDYARYDKYERDMIQRERDAGFKDGYTSGSGARGASQGAGAKGGSQFSVHFQSNLPPRFLRQQQQQERMTTQVPAPSSSSSAGGSSNRSIAANQAPSRGYEHNAEVGQKSIPFAQQYDPRHVHSQNYKQQQQQQQPQVLRRNASDEMMSNRRGLNEYSAGTVTGMGASARRRGDSEDDDRFSSSGRESISRNSIGEQQLQPSRSGGGSVTPQLARSISDSSQRKTSVSSSDEQKLTESFQSQRSDSREFTAVGSWAEESDIEMHKQHRESVSSLDHHHHHSHSRYDSGSQKEEEQPQPKHILQRPQTKSISESGAIRKDDMKSDSDTMRRDESGVKTKSREPPTPTQILRRSESPKSWSEYSTSAIDKSDMKADAHLPKDASSTGQLHDEAKTTITDDKKTEPAIDTNKEKSPVSAEEALRNKDAEVAGTAAKKESSDEKTDDMSGKMHGAGQKRPSPRGGGGRDSRAPPSRSYGMYRGGGSSWGRRGGSNMRMGDRRNYNSHLSETDNSDEFDDDYGGGHRMDRSPKFPRKESTGKQESSSGSRGGQNLSKDGFAPRGEPSRRGRGGGGSGSSSYRRGGSGMSGGQKRNEPYGGHQNSKLGFGGSGGGASHSSSDNKDMEKSSIPKQEHAEDKTKQGHSNQSTHSSGKKSGDSSDESKKKAQNYQSSGRRDDKKSSPPKTFGNSHYQSQSMPPRRDANSGSSISKGDTTPSNKPEDDDKKDGQHFSGDSASNRQPMREKEYPPRSNSSSHISSGRSLHPKKDERGMPKSSAPSKQSPPSMGSGGFKSQSGSNSNQSGQQQQASLQSHHGKDQGVAKGKPGVEGRESRENRDNRDNRDNRENRDSRDNRDARNNNSKTSLPPRLVKQWETRGGGGSAAKRDSNQSENSTNSQQSSGNNVSSSSAWDKPLAQQQALDNKSVHESESLLTGQQPTTMPDGKASSNPKADGPKTGLDSSSAPVNTIIFENTNYKSATGPVKRQGSNQGMQPMQQGDQKKQDEVYKSQSSSSLHDDPQGRGLQQQAAQQQAQTPQHMQQQLSQQQQIAQQQQQMHHQQHQQHASQQQEAITNALSQMSFAKPESDYDKDIKLGFAFDTEFSHLTDEKNAAVAASKAPSLGLPRSSSVIHSVVSSTSHNTISPSTVDLNMKIASVKKVWESIPSMPPVLEHAATVVAAGQDADSHLPSNFVQSQHQQHMHHFAPSGAALHAATHAAGNMHVQHTLSSPGPPSYTNTFDPNLEQHFGAKESGGVVVAGGGNEVDTGGYSPSPQHVNAQQQQQQQNQNNVQNMSLKHAVEGNVCKVKPNQQQLHQAGLGLSPPPSMQQGTTQMHQAPQPFYQPSQFGAMPTIPSPPAVLFNSSPMPSQGGLYGPFQIEAGRSQFSQFPAHYGTAGSGPYSAYMQTPPNMPTAPGPDMYPSLTSQFRMGGTVQTPFNQSQQLNNPNTVLISSSSNSLMSASVKPSSQQIGAIGSKSNAAAVAAAAASVGQPYGQQYMNLYPPQQAPPQLQSNSYYTNSAGGQGAAFFGGPQATGATQSYGLQAAGIFGAHGAPPGPSNAPPQQQIANFSSQFINSPLLAATAINQFRGGPNPQNPAYMKSNQNQNHMQDSMGRQLKSPLSADVTLNLAKQVQPQQSPPHHKNYAPTWDQMMQQQQQQQQQHQQQQSQNQQNRNSGPNNLNSGRQGPGAQRYPAPIQRPNNHPSYQQSSQPPQSQRPVRQGHSGGPGSGGGPMNKHYYNNSGPNRGGHSSNPNDHSMKSVNDKAIIVDNTAVNQQDMSIKDDGGNVE